jgi:hypothetical protein
MKSPRDRARNGATPNDVSSIDGVIKALYECVTFTPGKQPDYQRLKSLMHPRGRLAPPRDPSAQREQVVDIETFISNSREYVILTGLEKRGFCEQEIHRRTEAFGNIAHVFSTYASRHRSTDAVPIQRGINSIQLLFDENRWWVLSILWDVERVNNPLPSQYAG